MRCYIEILAAFSPRFAVLGGSPVRIVIDLKIANKASQNKDSVNCILMLV